MQITSAHTESVPFPKEGFQKWDVITPKNPEKYGDKYIVTDYRRWEHSNGKIEYYYHLNSYFGFGEICERNLDEYEKLYSQKREIAFRISNNIKDDIKHLLEIKNRISESLNIDTNLFTEGIERIEEFIRNLENVR